MSERWTGVGERWRGGGGREVEPLRRPPSSAPRWPSPSSRTPSCSPGRAVPPDCWPGCWGSARPVATAPTHNTQGATCAHQVQQNVDNMKYFLNIFDRKKMTHLDGGEYGRHVVRGAPAVLKDV